MPTEFRQNAFSNADTIWTSPYTENQECPEYRKSEIDSCLAEKEKRRKDTFCQKSTITHNDKTALVSQTILHPLLIQICSEMFS